MTRSETIEPRANMRITEILSKSTPLETAASRYLFKQCGFVPAPGDRVTAHIRRHPLLGDIAHGKGFYPAIIFEAVNEITQNRAIEIVYLTADGDLAPIKDPRLLIGALAGASIKVQEEKCDRASIIICERVEDALRIKASYKTSAVIAALRRENVLHLPALQQMNGRRSVGLYVPCGITAAVQKQWFEICRTLEDRTFMPSLLEFIPPNSDGGVL